MSSTLSRSLSLSPHTLRQLKFVLPGGAVTYYLQTHAVLWRMVNDSGWEGGARFVFFFFFAFVDCNRVGLTELCEFRMACNVVTAVVEHFPEPQP